KADLLLAKEQFELRNLDGSFLNWTTDELPFADDSFDLIYSTSVLSQTNAPSALMEEISRILRPGGQLALLAARRNSIQYWGVYFFRHGLVNGLLTQFSMAEILSRSSKTTPYTKEQLCDLAASFGDFRLKKLKGDILILAGTAKVADA